MKKIFLFITVAAITFFTACNNSGDAHQHASNEPKTKADSLLQEVMDGHEEAMAAQRTKLKRAKENISHLIDSISKLAARTKETAVVYKEKLDVVLNDLNKADEGMETWMKEFNYDSAVNNTAERLKYLSEEKLKISKVKEAIFNSVLKADSLVKQKF